MQICHQNRKILGLLSNHGLLERTSLEPLIECSIFLSKKLIVQTFGEPTTYSSPQKSTILPILQLAITHFYIPPYLFSLIYALRTSLICNLIDSLAIQLHKSAELLLHRLYSTPSLIGYCFLRSPSFAISYLERTTLPDSVPLVFFKLAIST